MRHGTSPQTIMQANGMKGQSVHAGKSLKIPSKTAGNAKKAPTQVASSKAASRKSGAHKTTSRKSSAKKAASTQMVTGEAGQHDRIAARISRQIRGTFFPVLKGFEVNCVRVEFEEGQAAFGFCPAGKVLFRLQRPLEGQPRRRFFAQHVVRHGQVILGLRIRRQFFRAFLQRTGAPGRIRRVGPESSRRYRRRPGFPEPAIGLSAPFAGLCPAG